MIREVFWIWGFGIGSISGGLNFMEGAGRVHRFVGNNFFFFLEGEYCVHGRGTGFVLQCSYRLQEVRSR